MTDGVGNELRAFWYKHCLGRGSTEAEYIISEHDNPEGCVEDAPQDYEISQWWRVSEPLGDFLSRSREALICPPNTDGDYYLWGRITHGQNVWADSVIQKAYHEHREIENKRAKTTEEFILVVNEWSPYEALDITTWAANGWTLEDLLYKLDQKFIIHEAQSRPDATAQKLQKGRVVGIKGVCGGNPTATVLLEIEVAW